MSTHTTTYPPFVLPLFRHHSMTHRFRHQMLHCCEQFFKPLFFALCALVWFCTPSASAQTLAWEEVPRIPFGTTVLAVSGAPDAAFGGVLVAGTTRGILRSTDNGATWDAFVSGIPPAAAVRAFAKYGVSLVAATSGGVYISSNQGISWAAAGLSLSSWAVAATANGILVGTSDGVFNSRTGLQWQRAGNGLGGVEVTSVAAYNDTLFFAGTNEGLYRSERMASINDNRGIWRVLSASIGRAPVTSLAMLTTPTSNTIYMATYGNGIFRSPNGGGTWIDVSTGLQSTLINSIAVAGDRLVASTYGRGVQITVDGGALWRGASFGLASGFVNTVSVVNNMPYIAGQFGGLYRAAFVPNPPPSIRTVTPSTVTASTQHTITIDGDYFRTPIITIDNRPVTTILERTATRLRFVAEANLLPDIGFRTIEVTNDDGQKVRARLTVTPKSAPGVFFLNPRLATIATFSIPLQVFGANFDSNAVLSVNGVPMNYNIRAPGTFLEGIIPVESIVQLGPVPVRVTNPNGEFGEAFLTVRAKPPTIKTLDPFAVSAGAPAFTLAIAGEFFSPRAQIQLNQVTLATVSQSTTNIVVRVPASLVSAIGTYPLTITNEDGQSITREFPVVNFNLALEASAEKVCPGAPITITGRISGGIEPFTIESWSPNVTSSMLNGRTITAVANPPNPATYIVVVRDASGVRLPQGIPLNTIQVAATPSAALVRFDTVNTFFRWITSKTVTIRNASLDGTVITLGTPRTNTNNFRVLTTIQGTTVTAGQSSPEITVQFQPERDGALTDTLFIPFEPCGGVVAIVLSGQRITPTLPPPVPNALAINTQGTVSASPAPSFPWQSVEFAASYSLHIARIERPFSFARGFEANDFAIVTTANTSLQPSFNLQPNTAYAWSVRAVNSATTSTWSVPRFFITAPAGQQRLTLEPTLFDFGSVLLGDEERRGTQIRVASGSQTTITGVDMFATTLLTGTPAQVFKANGIVGSRLTTRDPLNIPLIFAPTDTVRYQGVARIRTATDTLLALLDGRGTVCQIAGGRGCAETDLVLRFAPFRGGKTVPDVGDTVTLQLVLTRSARLTDALYADKARRFSADVIVQNPDVIYPLAVSSPANLTAQQVSVSPSRVRFTNVPVNRSATGETVLAEVQAEALLADTLMTSVRFTQFIWTDATPETPIRRAMRDTTITLATCLNGGSPRLIRPKNAGVVALLFAQPNPVVEAATAKFIVYETTPVSAFIVDVMGRRVKTLLNETLSSEEYNLTFSLNEFPVGAYLLVIQTPNEVHTHRLEAIK